MFNDVESGILNVNRSDFTHFVSDDFLYGKIYVFLWRKVQKTIKPKEIGLKNIRMCVYYKKREDIKNKTKNQTIISSWYFVNYAFRAFTCKELILLFDR